MQNCQTPVKTLFVHCSVPLSCQSCNKTVDSKVFLVFAICRENSCLRVHIYPSSGTNHSPPTTSPRLNPNGLCAHHPAPAGSMVWAVNPIPHIFCVLVPCPTWPDAHPCTQCSPADSQQLQNQLGSFFLMMYMICSLLLLVLAARFVILTAFHEQESCCNFCQESLLPYTNAHT